MDDVEISCEGRRLLASAEHYLPWSVLKSLTTVVGEKKMDIVEPVKVDHPFSPQFSFSIRFGARIVDSKGFCWGVYVDDLKSSDVADLRIKTTATIAYRRPEDVSAFAWAQQDVRETVNRMVKSSGVFAGAPVKKTHSVDVVVEVYAPVQHSALASDLSAARREGTLCDVVLTVEGQDFPAHKLVLAAR